MGVSGITTSRNKLALTATVCVLGSFGEFATAAAGERAPGRSPTVDLEFIDVLDEGTLVSRALPRLRGRAVKVDRYALFWWEDRSSELFIYGANIRTVIELRLALESFEAATGVESSVLRIMRGDLPGNEPGDGSDWGEATPNRVRRVAGLNTVATPGADDGIEYADSCQAASVTPIVEVFDPELDRRDAREAQNVAAIATWLAGILHVKLCPGGGGCGSCCGSCCQNPCCGSDECCDSSDPCCGVSCPECMSCNNGSCVQTDPCCGIDCGDCESCVDGQCVLTDPCCEVECGDCESCVDGDCVKTDPCCDVECGDCESCVDGGCVPDDDCCDVDCPECKSCNNGSCVQYNPCCGVDCPDCKSCENGACVADNECCEVTCPDCHRCSGGSCINDCRTDQICCNDSCCSGACCGGTVCCSSGMCCGSTCCPHPGGSCCSGAPGGCCPIGTNCCGNGECCGVACEECLDNGVLAGGSVTVSPEVPCLGGSITWTAKDVTDTGGMQRVFCSAKEDLPPEGVTYSWSLTLPPDYPEPLPLLQGQGPNASVAALVPGTYTATFTAEPERTVCPPEAIMLAQQVTVQQPAASIVLNPSWVSASTNWTGMPAGASESQITVVWSPPECPGTLEIAELEGDYVPPNQGTLTKVDDSNWRYIAFDEPQTEPCPEDVKVWIAANYGIAELARKSILVIPVHKYLTTGTTANLTLDYGYISWKYAAVLATTGGAFTGGVTISPNVSVSCGVWPFTTTGYACTNVATADVTFGTSTFTGSENQAASIIGHELVHAAGAFSECTAYTWEFTNDTGTGIFFCDTAYLAEMVQHLNCKCNNICP